MSWRVKIYRKLLTWEWYSEPLTKVVFLHFLLLCASQEYSYKWVKLLPWQCTIWIRDTAKLLGMSVQNLRTAITRLKSTHEITHQPTHKYTLITVVNWEEYQHNDCKLTHEVTHQLTNDQHSTNTVLTHNKEYKNNKNKKEKEIIINNNSSEKKISDVEEIFYGDPEINLVIDIIKKYNDWIVDGSNTIQRRYWKHLVNKLKQIQSVKENKYSWDTILTMILEIVSRNNYYSTKISWPKKIYDSLTELMNVCRQELRKKQWEEIQSF